MLFNVYVYQIVILFQIIKSKSTIWVSQVLKKSILILTSKELI